MKSASGIEASEVFSRYFCLFCIRAGRLTDGPYTSYDLNTLLKATAGERRAVLLGQGIYFLPKYDKWCSHLRRFVNECFQADNQVIDRFIATQLKQLRAYWYLFFFFLFSRKFLLILFFILLFRSSGGVVEVSSYVMGKKREPNHDSVYGFC